MGIINVYGATSMRQADQPEETEQYYDTLKATVKTYQKANYVVIVAGDFNANKDYARKVKVLWGDMAKEHEMQAKNFLQTF